MTIRQIETQTPDLTETNINKLARLFPDVITESRGKDGTIVRAVDFEALRQDLQKDGAYIAGRERYTFTWPGKGAAKLQARRPTNKTLRPREDRSVEWDTTHNVYIEGDNLEALKLLREAYSGKVKMIYIDPPYNTGHDFVYRDNFSASAEDYKENSGQYDEEGNRLVANLETNGRFHSDWCSMIYPRLLLSRDLLTEDGAIFISIDDNEAANLRKICDEVFGAQNFISQLVWSGGRKNDSHFISDSHEYILVYVKNMSYLTENNVKWRERKDGLESIYAEYNKLRSKYGTDYAAMTRDLKAWFAALPDNDPAKQQRQYHNIDSRGIYFGDNISWPGGGGPKFTILHPVTHKPVKIPSRGWIFTNKRRMQEMIANGMIEFGKDETKVPTLKRYLKDHETTAPYSVFYQDSRGATKYLRNLMGANVFDHPKDVTIIQKLISIICTNGTETVLDFFSGSGTTAEAVMRLNAEDNGHRRFILVQLPEKVKEGATAERAGYHTICEIGEERIRRAGQKIAEGIRKDNAQPELGVAPRQIPDIGFRVLKIDSSNFRDVTKTPREVTQGSLDEDIDNLTPERTPEDILFQILPHYGLPYSSTITKVTLAGQVVYDVDNGQLLACLTSKVTSDVIREMASRQPNYTVFLSSLLKDDSIVSDINALFTSLSPSTDIEVI